MGWRHFVTALVALLGACGTPEVGGQDAAREAGASPVPESPSTAGAMASKPSIMRPSVVEETERAQTAPAPSQQPVRATIGFPDGGARLDEAARSALDALLAQPRFNALGPITLRGHTDSEGSDAANLRVSRRRAEAVRDYLAGKGVPMDRMTVIALGERRPIAPNAELDGSDSEAGRQRNRRVDVEVAPPPT